MAGRIKRDYAMTTVLLVEDEALLASVVAEALVDAGYTLCGVAESAGAALAVALKRAPDLAVIDVRLIGSRDGIDLADDLTRLGRVGILFATAKCDEVKRRARVRGGCLAKPYRAEWLVAALQIVERGTSGALAAPPGFFSLSR